MADSDVNPNLAIIGWHSGSVCFVVYWDCNGRVLVGRGYFGESDRFGFDDDARLRRLHASVT